MNELSHDQVSTQHQLWPGIEHKIANAEFHRRAMEKAIEWRERTHMEVVQESAGAIIWNNWQQPLYAHLDAFLSAARSVPELIRCCFGVDNFGPVRDWFDALDSGEKDRRTQFQDSFRSDYNVFRSLPLGNARHISEHRTGVVPVSVKVTGRFGLIYVGNPITNIPNSEMRDMPEGYGWMQRPIPLHPSMGSDFQIDGMPLFETCRAYLHEANSLVQRARFIADAVHGNKKLTSPPMEL